MNKTRAGKIQYFNNKRGQLFPFLAIVIIFMIVAVMAFINTGQVNVRKVSTMNAADAGAMAGASQMATAANEIALVNLGIMGAAALAETEFLPELWFYYPFVQPRFDRYEEMSTDNIETFQGTQISGYKSVQHAGGSGLFTAFNNAPVDEAQRRSKDDNRVLQSGLGYYLRIQEAAQTIYGPVEFSRSYSWASYTYNLTADRQQASDSQGPGGLFNPNEEKVTVHIKKPSENALIPEPIIPIPMIARWKWSPYSWGCWNGGQCATFSLCSVYMWGFHYPAFWAAQSGAWNMRIHVWDTLTKNDLYEFLDDHDVDESTDNLETQAWLNVAFPICFGRYTPWPIMPTDSTLIQFCGSYYQIGPLLIYIPGPRSGTNREMCIFTYPVPGLWDLTPHDAKIEIDVTRYSPPKDLGLFQYFKQDIRSGSEAELHDGNVFSPGSYEIKAQPNLLD